MAERKFDRLISYDVRSADYPVRTVLPDVWPPRSYSWSHYQLDQGNEGACIGFAVTMEAAARPRPFFGDPIYRRSQINWRAVNDDAFDTYHQAQTVDQWPGEDYEGTSVIAGMKIGLRKGYWSEYRWALGPSSEAAARDVALSIAYRGPVVIGAWWWTGMDEPDADGFLRPNGIRRGGHAFLLSRYSRRLDAVWTPNSWGGAGQGWIHFGDLVSLLADDGEAAVPVVRLKAA